MIRKFVLSVSLSFCLPLSAHPQDPAKEPQPVGQETRQPLVGRIRVSGDVAKSQLKHKVPPVYPSDARDKRIQGIVHLHIVISTSGKVQQVEVISGDPILAKAAVEAVRQWEYKPTLLKGEPLEVDTTVDVTFSLRE